MGSLLGNTMAGVLVGGLVGLVFAGVGVFPGI
jgi:hypothetical protein